MKLIYQLTAFAFISCCFLLKTNDALALTFYSLRTNNGQDCLDVPGGNTSNGTRLIVWDCNGGNNQLWAFVGDTIRLKSNVNKCLDLKYSWPSLYRNGAEILLWDCHGGDNQLWKTWFNTQSSSIAPNYAWSKCLDVRGGNFNNGTDIILWDCHGGINQKWFPYTTEGRYTSIPEKTCYRDWWYQLSSWLSGCKNDIIIAQGLEFSENLTDDPLTAQNSSQSVPEPSSILGILGLLVLGVFTKLPQNNKQ